MGRIRIVALVFIVVLLGWFAPLYAQQSNDVIIQPHAFVGDTFTYQGLLMQGTTYPSGTFDFQFSLYDDPTAGTLLGQLQQDDVPVEAGQFTVALTFPEGSVTGHQRWLAIAVKTLNGSAYVPLNPRSAVSAAPIALSLPGLWTRQNDTSPNLIGGYSSNTVPANGVGMTIGGGGAFGNLQQIYDHYGVIGGGANNRVGSDDGTVTNDGYATISGGFGNTTTQEYTVIGGGQANTITGAFSTISGGTTNTIAHIYATIGGGMNNRVSAQFGTIGGGGSSASATGNRVYDTYSTISGGYNNVAGVDDTGNQPFATVGGGSSNNANALGSMVGGGRSNSISAIADYSVISGGYNNVATGLYATVSGGGSASSGQGNRAYDNYSTVAGGYNNVAGIDDSIGQPFTTVAGGGSNTASGYASAIGGGRLNQASGQYAFIGGGESNTATGDHTTIGAGRQNTANGNFSSILGGSGNSTSADYSVAAGENAVAAHRGSFVWASTQAAPDATITSTAPGQFIVRAPGGAWFGSSTQVDMPNGAILATDSGAFLSKGGTWSNSSDKHRKTQFAAIDPHALLTKLAAIPMQSWSYINEDPQIRHLGPTAQDFYAAFGLGTDDRHIATVDADGVALTAIQGLYQLNREQAAVITDLETRLAALETATPSPARSVWLLAGGWGSLLLIVGWLVGRRMRRGGTV
ncbi:hypothetical protein Haur_5099 (plasmid) [Herpetosiphon aurantiacus DSM 785]|uniref:Peptidase S74 domain-containing protein n=1 Tax=Herpetosiphon aurantiacus (strain ATCC 23779 / DSM 785 / 114-95) TaxID=316274 RepID=A9B8R3_HERA2|nr:hypothetical protein Haur_5099 [Herpetosiphon aurantiacus DSM 785]